MQERVRHLRRNLPKNDNNIYMHAFLLGECTQGIEKATNTMRVPIQSLQRTRNARRRTPTLSALC